MKQRKWFCSFLLFTHCSDFLIQIVEMLDVLIMLLESGRKQDQLYLLMFEPEMGEMLYGLLTLKGFTIIYYEKIVKVSFVAGLNVLKTIIQLKIHP